MAIVSLCMPVNASQMSYILKGLNCVKYLLQKYIDFSTQKQILPEQHIDSTYIYFL